MKIGWISLFTFKVIHLLFHNVVEGTLDLDPEDMKRAKEYENIRKPLWPTCGEREMNFAYGVCIDQRYEPKDPPNRTLTQIYYKINSFEILEIKEKESNIDLWIEITDSWEDDRIKFSTSSLVKKHDITINWYDKTINTIWYPDGIKMKRVSHESMMHKSDSPFTHLRFRKGKARPNSMFVSRIREMRMSLYCAFHSNIFPLDSQNCTFRLSNEDARRLQLLFDLDTNQNDTRVLEKFGFTISTIYEDGSNTKDSLYIGLNLKMKRVISPFVFQYYLPAAAVVFLSQIGLIIPLTSIPGRIGLLATIFLSLTNLFINHMVIRIIELVPYRKKYF